MNERMNETLLRRPRQPLYPKKYRVSRPRVFESLNSPVPDLVHLPTTFMMMMWLTYEIGLPLQSRAHFADLIFQKCFETLICICLTCSSGNRALASVLCTFCRPLPDRAAKLRKQRPSFGDGKNIGFRAP